MSDVTYLDLVSSVRKDRCRQGVDDFSDPATNPRIRSAGLRREWNVPSYDFGNQLAKLSDDDQAHLLKTGREMMEAGQLILPHSSFAISTHGEGYTTITLVSKDMFPGVYIKNKTHKSSFYAEFYYHTDGKDKLRWIKSEHSIDQEITIRGNPPKVNADDFLTSAMKMVFDRQYDRYRNKLIMCIVLLSINNNKVIWLDNVKIFSQTSANQIPRKHDENKSAHMSRSVLYLSVEAGRRVKWKPRTAAHTKGRGVMGHDRRGHWRTYKATGKEIWIHPCAVKGGPQGTPQTRTIRIKTPDVRPDPLALDRAD